MKAKPPITADDNNNDDDDYKDDDDDDVRDDPWSRTIQNTTWLRLYFVTIFEVFW